MKILLFVNTKQSFTKPNKLGGIEILNYELFLYLKKKYNVKLINSITQNIKKIHWDIVISSNDASVFDKIHAGRKILWLHNKLQIEKAIRKKQFFPIMFNKIETVFVSKYLEDNTSKIYNFKKRFIIPNFLPSIYTNIKFKKKYNYKKNIFVWSVQRSKGLEDIIDIWINKIHPLNLNCELHVFKKNNNKKFLSNYNIYFHGKLPRNKLLNFYKKSAGMICLGYDETFCLNAIEGMSMGLPVISLGETALKEIIINNKNGYKVNNLSKIHLKIIKFLKLSLKNKTKLSKSSISFSSKYNFDKIVKKWNKLILS